MLKANDFWQFSLTTYSQPGVKDSCLMLQDRWHHNVNILLACAYLDRLGQSLSLDDLQLLNQHIAESEEQLEQLRSLRRQAKSQDPQQYQALLSQELQWEKRQQQDIVDCLNSLGMNSSNSDNLSLYSRWVTGQSAHAEKIEALQRIRLAGASYSISSTHK